MVVAMIRSRIRPERAEEYYRKVDEMAAIATNMPGFISYKSYTSPDGERVSIHEWESAAELKAWREHPEHRKMQAYGRENFYLEYTIYVCEAPRVSRFKYEAAK